MTAKVEAGARKVPPLGQRGVGWGRECPCVVHVGAVGAREAES